jgi:hypothetical protein
VLVTIFAWPKKEPKYGGHYLSAWLQDCCRYQYRADAEGPGRAKAEEAVRRIGTNAFPYLLEGIRYERPQWVDKVTQHVMSKNGSGRVSSWMARWWFGVLSKHDQGTLAAMGFQVLGADAAPAIPKLVGLLDDRRSHAPASVLSEMGRLAEPEVLRALTNRSGDLHQRAEAAYVLELMGTNASDTLEVLKGCLGAEPVVAVAAASALTEVTTNHGLIIDALTNALVSPSAEVRSGALDALGECGAMARPAIGAIKARLVDEDEDVRLSATNALSMIPESDEAPGGREKIQ